MEAKILAFPADRIFRVFVGDVPEPLPDEALTPRMSDLPRRLRRRRRSLLSVPADA